jgi:F-type H+-transporting ATPase subunit b
MRPLHYFRQIALAFAAIVLAAGTASAESAAQGKSGDHKPHFYVKDGDKYRAATEAEIKAATSAEGGHGESGGLDFTGIKRYDLGIYTLIVFGILMLVLAKYAWPPMREGLEKRESNIKSALEQAKQDHAAASALLAQAKKQTDDAAVQVKAMLDEARRDADVLRASEREAAAKDIVAEKDRAKREIAAEKDAILKEVYDQSVKLAAMMSEKAIRRSVSADDHRRLLDESLAELRSANKA